MESTSLVAKTAKNAAKVIRDGFTRLCDQLIKAAKAATVNVADTVAASRTLVSKVISRVRLRMV
ncbi:hypothetical protein [Roseibium album]|uniref:hypothetical protein n=1 Tax=Roseibium album TaxID=311410 RepID=UPI003BB083A2